MHTKQVITSFSFIYTAGRTTFSIALFIHFFITLVLSYIVLFKFSHHFISTLLCLIYHLFAIYPKIGCLMHLLFLFFTSQLISLSNNCQ